jgi:hypothetical protein
MAVYVPDYALVVRGGNPRAPQQSQRMADQAELAYDRGLGYALSVFADAGRGLSRDELIKRIAAVRPIPNRQLVVTTAGQLRRIGCQLVPDGQLPCHVRVILGTEPDPAR